MTLYPLLILSLLVNLGTSEDPWSFLVLADWHGGESFAPNPVNDTYSNNIYYDQQLETLKRIKTNYGGELVVLPGDTNNGKWDKDHFHEQLEEFLGLKDLSRNEAIIMGGENSYSTTKRLFSEAGYDKILVALGDHEIGGNSWSLQDSTKINALPLFRGTFSKELNEKDGEHIYSKPIGSTPSRPIGTTYADTSFAHVHKNVLFVTVDAFHNLGINYQDREHGQGGEGIVTCTVEGDHLTWFENVLKEARDDSSIKHIFVQAHVPIIQPVRKMNCSGQYFDAGKESEFWKVMQTYGVDVYFAGEVHANTATKDESSNLLQVVSRANRLNNIIKVEVTEDGFSLLSLNEVGKEWRWNAQYAPHGEVVVDKSGEETSIQSSGVLEIVDSHNCPLIWLGFDEDDKYILGDRQVIGLKYNEYLETLVGHSIAIRGVNSTEAMQNHGAFGRQYDAQIANLEFDNDDSGALFSDQSRMAIGSIGPMAAGERISLSFSFKTNESKEMILIFYGGRFGLEKSKDSYLLTLDKGDPILYMDKKRYLKPEQSLNLDDGNWHHIRVSMPKKSCLHSEVEVHVDDAKIQTQVHGQDEHLFFSTSGQLSFGGLGYSSKDFGTKLYADKANFEGMMDDFILWHGEPKESLSQCKRLPAVTRAPTESPTGESLYIAPINTSNGISTRQTATLGTVCMVLLSTFFLWN